MLGMLNLTRNTYRKGLIYATKWSQRNLLTSFTLAATPSFTTLFFVGGAFWGEKGVDIFCYQLWIEPSTLFERLMNLKNLSKNSRRGVRKNLFLSIFWTKYVETNFRKPATQKFYRSFPFFNSLKADPNPVVCHKNTNDFVSNVILYEGLSGTLASKTMLYCTWSK